VEEKGTDVADVADLVGQHRYQLDAKGRMALPVKFREAFSEGGYVTLGEDGCLYVFSRAEWNRRAEGARSRITAGRGGGDYARGFFVPPGLVSFSINVDYDRQNNPPTLAPDFTGIPSTTFLVYKHLTVNGQVQVAAPEPVAVGPGQAVDAAISDQRFWGFASTQPTASCGSNLFPTEANGVVLPAGPIWERGLRLQLAPAIRACSGRCVHRAGHRR